MLHAIMLQEVTTMPGKFFKESRGWKLVYGRQGESSGERTEGDNRQRLHDPELSGKSIALTPAKRRTAVERGPVQPTWAYVRGKSSTLFVGLYSDGFLVTAQVGAR